MLARYPVQYRAANAYFHLGQVAPLGDLGDLTLPNVTRFLWIDDEENNRLIGGFPPPMQTDYATWHGPIDQPDDLGESLRHATHRLIKLPGRVLTETDADLLASYLLQDQNNPASRQSRALLAQHMGTGAFTALEDMRLAAAYLVGGTDSSVDRDRNVLRRLTTYLFPAGGEPKTQDRREQVVRARIRRGSALLGQIGAWPFVFDSYELPAGMRWQHGVSQLSAVDEAFDDWAEWLVAQPA